VGPCDSTGTCAPPACPGGFACLPGTATCAQTCAGNASCDTQHFCDTTKASGCCPLFKAGDVINVDSVNGNDLVACCGSVAAPCQTLTRAMSLVARAPVAGLVINAFNGDKSSDWSAAETWPVHLGWGVTLKAAGIFFSMPQPAANDASTLSHFEVYSYGATDNARVTIEGDLANPVHIGFDSTSANGGALTAVVDPAQGKIPVPLTLSSAWLLTLPKSARCVPRCFGPVKLVVGAGLEVGPGAAVTLGPGPVQLGDPASGKAQILKFAGRRGLFCHGQGATVTDDPAATKTVLQSANNTTVDLDIESGCQVTLTQGPVIGLPLAAGACDPSQAGESIGIHVQGGSSLTFGSAILPASIQCCSDSAVKMDTSDATGVPAVTLDHASVIGAGCAGAYVGEGTFAAKSSSFTQNFLGVWADSNAVKVDLSGGETLTCNSATSPALNGNFGGCSATVSAVPSTGIDLLDTTASLAVNARNATWDNWDATAKQTQLWNCSDTTYGNCTCSGPGCPTGGGATAPPDDADGVFLRSNTAATPIDSSSGAAAVGCP
jgi:hypothetical protein